MLVSTKEVGAIDMGYYSESLVWGGRGLSLAHDPYSS